MTDTQNPHGNAPAAKAAEVAKQYAHLKLVAEAGRLGKSSSHQHYDSFPARVQTGRGESARWLR